jgi:hypothetical protein
LPKDETNMNDMTVCGNYDALVSYLYDECDGAQREAIAEHLARCATCAEEIGALRDTRAHLASWTPPALPLGFQITRTDAAATANVLRPARWWKQPLPAWGQVAAATLIFAAGMSVSSLRSSPAAPVATPADVTAVAAPAVSRNDLARLEARLQSIEAAPRMAPVQLPRTAGGQSTNPSSSGLSTRWSTPVCRRTGSDRFGIWNVSRTG